jgi:hypothetical protein
LPGTIDAAGRPAPNLLFFSPAADRDLQAFERWLEPQLAEGEDLALLAGWGSKLAGAVARIAGIFHVADALGQGKPWQVPIGKETVDRAIRLAREYLMPHALAAFSLMGADPRVELAKIVLEGLARSFEHFEHSVRGGPPLTVRRRDLQQRHRGHSRLQNAEDLDAVLALLIQLGWLAPVVAKDPRRGRPSGPSYWVNPAITTYRAGTSEGGCPPWQYAQNAQNADADGRGDAGEGAAE